MTEYQLPRVWAQPIRRGSSQELTDPTAGRVLNQTLPVGETDLQVYSLKDAKRR